MKTEEKGGSRVSVLIRLPAPINRQIIELLPDLDESRNVFIRKAIKQRLAYYLSEHSGQPEAFLRIWEAMK